MFRLQRLVKDLLKQLQGQDSGQWTNNKVSGLDRTLGEISRILEKQVEQQKDHINIVEYVIELYVSFIGVVIIILIYWLYINDQQLYMHLYAHFSFNIDICYSGLKLPVSSSHPLWCIMCWSADWLI